MIRRWFAILLLTLSVCFQAVGSVTVRWVCEGKVCSTDPVHCCCTNPDLTKRDKTCATKSSNGCVNGECDCRPNAVRTKVHFNANVGKPFLPASQPIVYPQPGPVTVDDANTGRIPETPLLAKPPPGNWKDPNLNQALLRAPPL